jgi:hypothetical protein
MTLSCPRSGTASPKVNKNTQKMTIALIVLESSIGSYGETHAQQVKFPDFVANTATFVKHNLWVSNRSERAAGQLDASTDSFGKFSIVGGYDERDMVFFVEAKQQVLYFLTDA